MQYFTRLSCFNRIGLYKLQINSIEDLKFKTQKKCSWSQIFKKCSLIQFLKTPNSNFLEVYDSVPHVHDQVTKKSQVTLAMQCCL